EISVTAKWIKSGTLVEFEAMRDRCLQYNTSETCQNATTSIVRCFWCERERACIESNDQNTHYLKVNDCRVEKNPDVNDLNSSTTMKHSETTLGITEVENMSTGVTDENEHHISHWYLFVVIPLVAFLFFI
ncbi:unnamed protein product, partial [Schistosoma rodhaini]